MQAFFYKKTKHLKLGALKALKKEGVN